MVPFTYRSPHWSSGPRNHRDVLTPLAATGYAPTPPELLELLPELPELPVEPPDDELLLDELEDAAGSVAAFSVKPTGALLPQAESRLAAAMHNSASDDSGDPVASALVRASARGRSSAPRNQAP